MCLQRKKKRKFSRITFAQKKIKFNTLNLILEFQIFAFRIRIKNCIFKSLISKCCADLNFLKYIIIVIYNSITFFVFVMFFDEK